jgi:hypothetical protein
MTDDKKELIDHQKRLTEETTALQKAFKQVKDTGIKFQNTDAEVLASFRAGAGGRNITIEDGEAYVVYDGSRIGLAHALERYAFDAAPGEVDRRTLPRSGTIGRRGTLARSEMTLQEKVAFIRENGEEAFAAIPTHPPTSTEIVTREQFRRLSVTEKSRMITAAPDIMSKLAPAPSPRPHGCYINHEAMAKHLATRGKLAK